jgi:hypothetical protein
MNAGVTRGPDDSGWYEIRLAGRLDRRWSTWLDGMDLRSGAGGTTVLAGYVVDQSALHGLLARIRDIGLPLISVVRIEPDRGRDIPPHTIHDTSTGG